jgi:UDP-N-acetylglucosamine 2-epimerase (non-hydrolysing)
MDINNFFSNIKIIEGDLIIKKNINRLDLSKLEKINNLDCSFNKLVELDLSNLKEINYLVCNYNKLVELNLSNLKKIDYLNIEETPLSYLTKEIPKLFQENSIKPDLIMFLGDSNSAGVAFPLKKEGYKIGHIEAGMRSYDKRMLEEINRTVCDHCSDILFVYHDDYKAQLAKENITKNVFVVGNTIVEPLNNFKNTISSIAKRKDMILMDIHRPENFKYKERLINIINFGNECITKYNIPVKLLYFKRLKDALDNFNIDLGKIEMIPLLPYKEYLETVYHSKFIISDSGTGQEEPALLETPVVVPRDYTERPQSYESNCSVCFRVGENNLEEIYNWLNDIEMGNKKIDGSWLGTGETSRLVIKHLKEFFN